MYQIFLKLVYMDRRRKFTYIDGSNLKNLLGKIKKPYETDYLQYFDHLHTDKQLKASTIWSMYSC